MAALKSCDVETCQVAQDLEITSSLQPDSSSSLQPENSSSLQPESSNSLQPDSSNSLQPESSNSLQPESSNSLQPESSNSLQPESSSSLQPESSSSLQPESSSSLQPESSSSLQPESSSSLQPESSSSLQPGSSDSVTRSTEVEEDAQRAAATTWDLVMEKYSSQTKRWPSSGRHILAQFDDTSVVVYQAFKPSIAEYAVTHQRFGGPHYSKDRMTWIKTNFLWMMYRCGWGTKVDQERVLAVRLNRNAFDHILSQALTGQEQKTKRVEKKDCTVRLQWDPDHDPTGTNLQRRAIQLGLKGKVLLDYTSTYILNIKDITDFVREQYHILRTQGQHAILTPRETVYTPSNSTISDLLGLDLSAEQTVVSF